MPVFITGSDGSTTGSGGSTTYSSSYGHTTISSTGSFTIGSGGTTEISGGGITISSSSPALTITRGDLSVGGTISGSGQTTLGANLLMSGDQYVGGTLNVSGASTFGGSFLPADDNTYDLGSVAKRWANLYTGDLHLKNERGDWTVVEEEEYLTLRNNKTGKRYKLAMEEID